MHSIEKKLEYMDMLASHDPKYQTMLMECRALEKQVLTVLEKVLSEDNDLLWDYIMLCESMSQRKLFLACQWLQG